MSWQAIGFVRRAENISTRKLRGHDLVLIYRSLQDDRPPVRVRHLGTYSKQVGDICAAHQRFTAPGFEPGEIQDDFEVRESGGNGIVFNRTASAIGRCSHPKLDRG